MPKEGLTLLHVKPVALTESQLGPIASPRHPVPRIVRLARREGLVTAVEHEGGGQSQDWRVDLLPYYNDLARLTAIPRTIALGKDSCFTVLPSSTIVPNESLGWLIRARESQVVKDGDASYLCSPHEGRTPPMDRFKATREGTSFVGRILLATIKNDEVFFIGRLRRKDDDFPSFLEIPGGIRKRVEAANADIDSDLYGSSKDEQIESVRRTVEREVGEELLEMLPTSESRAGVFLSLVEGDDKSYFETAEVHVLKPGVFNRILDARRVTSRYSGIRRAPDWEELSLDSILRDGLDALPSVAATLQLMKGVYISSYTTRDKKVRRDWGIRSAFLPFDDSFVAWRHRPLQELMESRLKNAQ